ncbi:conserved Plasmodium protein, unknown function [Plasmodium vinckei brucechwatti]|uniref:RlmI-like PUA domain-containing protein n=1 Tax=Plasmodium vinckei brucechwatti TaxID=119398 RepID=A0A6V7T309_PLAVN|nr:conserved Plasmodium protein, unknown function [Plasmodium vinckei brucechwatti]
MKNKIISIINKECEQGVYKLLQHVVYRHIGSFNYQNCRYSHSKLKYEKNTKFKDELYKYHYEPYIDNANSRPCLYLKDDEENVFYDKKLKKNFPFIYSNQVKNIDEIKQSSLTLVNIKNNKNESFGVATFNPYSLITARIISTNHLFTINIHFFIERIKQSLLWRSKIINGELALKKKIYQAFPINNSEPNQTLQMNKEDNTHTLISQSSYPQLNSNNCYRLINCEGDNIPGLIIDRYDDIISIQHLTLGCEMMACNINDAIIELLNPKAIIFRNDNKERLNEKLEIYKKVIYGKISEQVILNENGCFFLIDLINSPNTGWFFNRKHLRNIISNYACQKTVLDLFSYVGSFGIQCLKNGKAMHVTCVEKDKNFVQLAKQSAIINNIPQPSMENNEQSNIEFICLDAITFLKNCNKLYDIIILDPPNLIPKSKFIESGTNKYIDLINLAQNYVTPNGLILIIFTTKLLSYQNYINIINTSFHQTKKSAKIVGQGRASPDHPANLSLYQFSDFYWFLLQVGS